MHNKYKVLMFGPGPTVMGGISSVVNDWLEAGIEQKLNLKYISTLQDGKPGRYIGKLSDALKAYFKLLVEVIKPADIAHIHLSSYMSFYRKLIIFWLVKTRNIKTVVHLHGSMFREFYEDGKKFQKKLITWMFDNADAIIVLSESWSQFISEISNNRNIHIVYNGIDAGKFKNISATDKNKITISFLGRLGKRKGTYDLLEAFAQLNKEIPNTELMLAGDGDIEKIQTLIDKKELHKQVHVLGWITGTQKLNVLANTDIYALPSYNEGLPVSILEAMASELPIISTPIGGIPEAIIEGRNGFLVQPGDIDTLCLRLSELCRNQQLRHKMGHENIQIISQKFDIHKLIDELLTVYKQIITTKP